MTPAWAQRREELLSDCLVSPDVFTQMVERLGEFIVLYQQALETEADQRSMHLYLCFPKIGSTDNSTSSERWPPSREGQE